MSLGISNKVEGKKQLAWRGMFYLTNVLFFSVLLTQMAFVILIHSNCTGHYFYLYFVYIVIMYDGQFRKYF